MTKWNVEITYQDETKKDVMIRDALETRILTECTPPILRVQVNSGRVRNFSFDGVQEVDVWEVDEE